ncbi:MAG: hypothetical protein QNJ46_35840 [Leptolyngbyaceae cyanobacterium MO_188.B28]|nr:hypothetical protein [Leptolyngbyaceae cyanobacterium MO_188.B28]
MSDTTGFLAGCATTGMAVLLLLVARVGLEESPPVVQSLTTDAPGEATPPLPVPSPPNAPQAQSASFAPPAFRRDLDRHRDVIERLESQLDDQQLLIRNLEHKLDRQQTETAAIVAQLKEYQYSIDTLATQQQLKSAELSQAGAIDSQGQRTLLWMGAGVILILIFGGGVVLVILILVAAQNRRRSSRNAQITHPMNVTPSYRYYQHEFLPPPPLNPKPAGQYEPYDYDG